MILLFRSFTIVGFLIFETYEKCVRLSLSFFRVIRQKAPTRVFDLLKSHVVRILRQVNRGSCVLHYFVIFLVFQLFVLIDRSFFKKKEQWQMEFNMILEGTRVVLLLRRGQIKPSIDRECLKGGSI